MSDLTPRIADNKPWTSARNMWPVWAISKQSALLEDPLKRDGPKAVARTWGNQVTFVLQCRKEPVELKLWVLWKHCENVIVLFYPGSEMTWWDVPIVEAREGFGSPFLSCLNLMPFHFVDICALFPEPFRGSILLVPANKPLWLEQEE